MIFKRYYKLVCKLYPYKPEIKTEDKNDTKKRRKKNKKHPILEDAEKYYQEDEYGFKINKLINKYIHENKTMKGDEIVNCVMKYDTYYIDEKHIYKRDVSIFDKICLDDIEDAFIEEFRSYKFEEVFKKYIYDYLSSLTSRISTISRFDTVIKLVNIENIVNIGIFLNLLDDKYKSIGKIQWYYL